MISLLLLIISYFYLHNLTHGKTFEYLKQEILGNKAEDEEDFQRLWSTKDIVTNWNLMFLLCTEAFLSYNFFQMDLIITMTAVKTYQLTIMQLGILTVTVSASSTFLLYNIQKRLLGNGLNIYYLYILGFVIIALFESFMLLMWTQNLKSFYSQLATLFVFISCNMVQGFGSTVYCRWLMFSSTPSHSASIVESHRFILCRVLASIGFFTSSYAFEVLWLIIPVYVSICFLIVALYFVKRNDYIKL